MTILIDASKYGRALKSAQRVARIDDIQMRTILQVTKSELRAYRRGTHQIPDDKLIHIMGAGLSFLAFRYRMCAGNKKRMDKK